MFRQRGNKLESYGNPLTLRYQPDADDDLVIQCWADHAPTLLAGQTDGCGISLDVTGSPADIAAGKKATRDIVIHGLGGGDFGFMKFFVTLEAPLEAPENPCYVWNPATSSYELDHSIPGCSSGSPGGGQASLLNERRLLLPNAATGLEPSPDPISVAKAGQFPSIPTIEVGEAAEE